MIKIFQASQISSIVHGCFFEEITDFLGQELSYNNTTEVLMLQQFQGHLKGASLL